MVARRQPHLQRTRIMSSVSVFGAQWGDEGKGKIIDLLSQDVDVVVRYQGGATPATPSSSAERSTSCT